MDSPDAETPEEEPRKPPRPPVSPPGRGAGAGQTDWLGHLRRNMPESGADSEPGPADDQMEDWLGRVREWETAGADPQEEALAQEPGDDDFLRARLTGEADDETDAETGWQPPPTSMLQQEEESDAPPPPPEAGDVPDWLKGGFDDAWQPPPTSTLQQPAAPIEPEPEEPPGDDVPEWLQASLAAVQSPASPTEPQQEEPEPEPDYEPPEWLRVSTPEVPASDTESEAVPDEEAALPGWLFEESPEAEADVKPVGTADLPSWLHESKEEAEPEAEPIATGDLPEWITAEEAPAPEASSVPDWLAGAAADIAASPGSTQSLEPPQEEAESPAAAAAPEDEDSTIDFQPSPSDKLPDWLEPSVTSATPDVPEAESPPTHVGDLDFSEFLVDAEPAVPANAVEAGDDDRVRVPDWLADIQIDTPAAAPDASETFAGKPGGEVPSTDGGEVPSTDGGEVPSTDGGADADTIDWLASIETPGDEQPPAEAAPSIDEAPAVVSRPDEDQLDFISEADDRVRVPDWLAAVGPQDLAPAPPDSGSPEDLPVAADMPDWLAAMRPAGMDMPTRPPEPPPPAETVAAPPEEVGEPEPDELPEWARAIDEEEEPEPATVRVADVDDYQETAGPLAGMRGVIRAEPAISLPGKPGASVANFVVTDWQREQADIFRKLMREEIEDLPEAPKRRLRLPFAVDRLIVFLLLLLAVVAPFALEQTFFDTPNPELFPTNRALLESIAALPQDSLVLVAFDYDPGMGGELNDGMDGLLQQLVVRGHRIALVSSRPAGVGVAQAVVESALAAAEVDASEAYGGRYVNLGYIPGGAIGMQAFAANPVEVIDVDFIRGESPWGMEAMRDARALQDFDLVVVASDSPTFGRAWLEQLRPRGVPMAAVVTAATQPLLQPFAEGDDPQLVGLSGGLAGAFVNDVIAPRGASPVSRRWDSYSAGVLAAGLILLVGNVIWVAIGLARQGAPFGRELGE